MSQPPSTDEILQRMRVHVGRQSAEAQSPLVTQPLPPPVSPDGGALSDFLPRSHDFSQLRLEIETALEGTRQVGQINPRNPGLHNSAIQFVKKAMRRSLTWYTRPIHHFQGGVIRALQQTLVLLQGQQESLQTASRELGRQASLIEHGSQQATNQRAAWAGEMAALKQKDSSLELVLEQGMSELHQEVNQEFNQELDQTRIEFEQRLVRVIADLDAKLSRMDSVHAESLDNSLAPYSQRIAGITDEIQWLRSELSHLGTELREINLQNRVRDRDLRRYFHDIEAGTLSSPGQPNLPPIPPMFPSGIKRESEFDYFVFEERYRGSEAVIADRQKEYLGYFQGCENVVDIGCGRGEFLELLRENGISSRGVELGTDQFLLCREKALEVVQQDLFSYLESVPDESLGGLFSAQVIEHLAASDQLRFVSLAYRKTRPGSPVIFETINAQCVFAVMRNFFVDPTHVRPVHPETLKFAMESVKFHDVAIRFSSPMTERQIPPLKLNGCTPQLAEFNRAMAGLNELIYGDMDYAVIGWR
jgi:SAM-dependent methyltransferase